MKDGPKRTLDVEELLRIGPLLDERYSMTGGTSLGVWLAESLLRVRDREGVERRQEFERRRGRQNVVLKARQMGITTWVAGRMFLKTITRPGTMTVQVAHTREAAEAIFRTVQRFWECLPVTKEDGVFRLSRLNAGQMRFAALDSEFRVVSAGDSNAGRGLTIQNLHLSEVSRWTGEADLTLAGLRAALAPGGELVMESTPNGAYGCFYDQWRGAKDRGLVRHFYPWWKEPAYVGEAVTEGWTEEERRLVDRAGLSPEQVGFRRELERAYRGMRLQEFAEDAESCFRASGLCCFDIAAVDTRVRELEEEQRDAAGGELAIFFPVVPGRQYLVAVDTAGGGGDGDFSVCEVLEMETGLQCAELRRRMGTLETAERAARLAREYGGATVAVERNNHGAGVLAYLHSRERYEAVYERGGVAGWLTTAANKPEVVSRLGALLAESPQLFWSRRLLGECRSFVTHRGGRMGAATGAHDDCVMAMAVAHAVRAEMLLERRIGGLQRRLEVA